MLKIILIIAAILFLIGTLLNNQKHGTTRSRTPLAKLRDLEGIAARAVVTEREKAMFMRLVAALPGCTILTQVAFSALITTTSKPTRNRFDRKVSDFVICNKNLDVIAIVELDDSTHANKKDQDADRDAMLQRAGYRTLRYPNTPSIDQVQADIAAIIRPSKPS